MFQSDLSLQNCKEVINRALNVFSKLEYNKDNISIEFILKMIPYLEKQNIENGYSNHVLRLIIRIFQNQEFTQLIQDQIKQEIYVQLVQYLCVFILQDDEMRFVNTCLLGGLIVQIIPDSSKGFKQIIPRLITIVRDNAGLKRKNSAIFLAKLSKDENNLEVIRQLHGIELLHNVSRFITQ